MDGRLQGIADELTLLADTGATLDEMDTVLARKRLKRKDYNLLWAVAWALIRRQGARLQLGGTNGHGAGET